MEKNLTITIGIPAHNEASNIGRLLESLQKQEQVNFSISEIAVISDGSTDKTENIVHAIAEKDRRVLLFADGKRLGKPARINELFARTQSAVVVILDADILLEHKKVLQELLRPLIESPKIMHVSGYALPLPPKNVVEKIAYAGFMIWEHARRQPEASALYLSEGSIRAFRRDVYTRLRFPDASADEAYSFLFCAQAQYMFAWAEKARVFYQLPKTFFDYTHQMKRFLKSNDIQTHSFNDKFVSAYYTIDKTIKLRSLIQALSKNFFWTTMYLLSVPIPRVLCFFDKAQSGGIWETVVSTKSLPKYGNR